MRMTMSSGFLLNTWRHRTRIFLDWDEALFLALPIIFIAAAMFFTQMQWSEDSLENKYLVRFLLLTIGLQTAHNAFTFSLLLLPFVSLSAFLSGLGNHRHQLEVLL